MALHRRSFRFDAAREARASRFAAELADALHELRITHKTLAQELGVTHHTVDSWTRGTDPKVPEETNLEKLCALLEAREPGLGKRVAAAAGHNWEESKQISPALTLLPLADEVSPNNLPLALTELIGREQALAELVQLADSARLLTLTGAGGIGKTRLAIQLGVELLSRFPDGVWLVELAALSDPNLVPQAVASALSAREQPGHSITQTLIEHLQPRRVCLILDNCEHLISSCAQLAAILLPRCPKLTIIATSREVLHTAGETTWIVPPLEVPSTEYRIPNGPEKLSTEYSMLDSVPSVALFVERARAGRPDFALTERNALAVAKICRELDGMPLAIELAAANTRALSVEQIASRLSQRFGLLTGGSRAALPRHQTLRAAVDWSYDLLSEQERALFRLLAVFAGGWDLKALESLHTSMGFTEDRTISLLKELIDKSLVVMEERDGEARYRMLETIREYAQERLIESGEYEAAKGQHLRYYGAMVRQAEIELQGENALPWMDRLQAEYDNIRAALGWALHLQDGEAAGWLAFGLYRFWDRIGYGSEALMWLEAVVGLGDAVPPEIRVQMYNIAGIIAYNQVDYDRATQFYEQTLTLAREIGDMKRLAGAINNLGLIAKQRGDYARAESLITEYLEMQRAWGDQKRVAMALCNLSDAPLYQGDLERAQALCEESLGIFHALGDEWSASVVAEHLGLIALRQGDYDQAMQWFQKHREGQLKRKGMRYANDALKHLGLTLLHKEEYSQAASYFAEALTIYQGFGVTQHMAECLAGLAVVAAQSRDAESAWRAGVMLGASEVMLASAEKLIPPNQDEYDTNVALVRATLDAVQLASAWEAGKVMPLEEVIAIAIGVAPA